MIFIHCALKIKVWIMPVVQLFIKSENGLAFLCILLYYSIVLLYEGAVKRYETDFCYSSML